MSIMSSRAAAASLAAFVFIGSIGSAYATNGANGGTGSVPQAGPSPSLPPDITINGDPDPTLPPAEAIVLDGDYAIVAGGTSTTAVLGAVTFDPAGTVVGGTLSFIDAAAAPAPEPLVTTTALGTTTGTTTTNDGNGLDGDDDLGGDDGLGGDDDPTEPGLGGTAAVTDCAITGGTYSLVSGGSGEAQLQIDCGGSPATATWRLFVTGTQGLAVAQQFRAVQLETLPGAAPEIVDLTLSLR
jgi:hypothetical protein